jgi:hypothetical protein
MMMMLLLLLLLLLQMATTTPLDSEDSDTTTCVSRRRTKPKNALLGKLCRGAARTGASSHRSASFYASFSSPFIRSCCLGTPPFSSKVQEAHVAAAGLRPARFYSLVREIGTTASCCNPRSPTCSARTPQCRNP